MRSVFSLPGAVAILVWASSIVAGEVPSETATHRYVPNRRVPTPQQIDALKSGYPLGGSEEKEASPDPKTEKEKEPEKPESIAQQVERIRKANRELLELQKKAEEKIAAELAALLKGRSGTPIAPPKEPKKPVPPLDENSRKRFLECAPRAIGFLKRQLARQLNLVSETPLPDAQLIEQSADGEQLTKNGVACGKHLGPLGWRTARDYSARDIQVLRTLAARSDKDEQQLLWTLWHAFQRASRLAPGSVRREFWTLVWQTISFRAVFTESPIGSARDWHADYVRVLEATEIDIQDPKAKFRLKLAPSTPVSLDTILEDWRVAEAPVRKAFP